MPSSPADSLPAASRLALTCAPSAVRAQHEALFLLDARLAGIVRSSREPMLAQLRLAWWRECLDGSSGNRPEGEPLLALLSQWRGPVAGLISLVNGWEALVGGGRLDATAIVRFADGRASAWAALAEAVGESASAGAASAAAREWAMADVAARLSHPGERDCAREVAAAEPWHAPGLPRALRPLTVLHGLGRRSLRRGGDLLDGPMAVLTALRLGLAGR